MSCQDRATRIELFRFDTPPMRAFHLAWLAFFTAFFSWFAVAPLLSVIRDDLGLSDADISASVVASAIAAIFLRIAVGPLCDRFGPRRTHGWLLLIGAVPVMAVGLVQSGPALVWLRFAIGAVGASFIVTQYHTAVMFAPNCVGTAAATTAGWGNLGGGVAQLVMPLVFAALLALGAGSSGAWRLAMLFPGVCMILVGCAYLRFTQDGPLGNRPSATEPVQSPPPFLGVRSVLSAVGDLRVLALALMYGASFGTQLAITNVAALLYHDRFHLDVKAAGFLAGLFGITNLFARTLGGYCSDRAGLSADLPGRVRLVCALLLLEGVSLALLARADSLAGAVAFMALFGILVQMASGASFAIVPFVRGQSLGAVAGIVGAGGNLGAVAAGATFYVVSLSNPYSLLVLGLAVCAVALVTAFVPFAAPRTGPAAAAAASTVATRVSQ